MLELEKHLAATRCVVGLIPISEPHISMLDRCHLRDWRSSLISMGSIQGRVLMETLLYLNAAVVGVHRCLYSVYVAL